MSNEKMSEGGDWKDRLNRLEDLPGTDPAWKEDTWEQLYDRLRAKEEKPRKKRAGWYWAAAACLLIVGALFLLRGRSTHDQPLAIHAADSPNMEKDSVLVIASQTPAQGAASGGNSRKKETEASIHVLPLAIPDPRQERPAVFADSIVLASEAPLIVAPAPRKLRVVHINELGMPVQDDNPSSRMAGNFFLRIRLLDGQSSTNQLGSNYDINTNQSFTISIK